MADARNPCLRCDSLYTDKDNDTCAECSLRINYVRELGYFTESNFSRPNKSIVKDKPPASIKEMPEIIAILDKIREAKKNIGVIPTCKEDGCDKIKLFSMGFCKTHYLKDLDRRKSDGGYSASMAHMSNRGCKTEGCNNKHHGLGYCESCYKKQFLMSLQINKKIFTDAAIIISKDYAEISNNKIVENILKLFIAQKGCL